MTCPILCSHSVRLWVCLKPWFSVKRFVGSQASDVSRSRGASLMARPGNSLVAAIRSQHHADSQQLNAPCRFCHSNSRSFKAKRNGRFVRLGSCLSFLSLSLSRSHQHTMTRLWRSFDSQTYLRCCRSDSPASAETMHWGVVFDSEIMRLYSPYVCSEVILVHSSQCDASPVWFRQFKCLFFKEKNVFCYLIPPLRLLMLCTLFLYCHPICPSSSLVFPLCMFCLFIPNCICLCETYTNYM